MSDKTNKINTADEFRLITDKRLALESLIKIAHGIYHQQDALNELALAARPSQDFPDKVVKYFAAIKKKLKDHSVAEVIERMDKIEAVTHKHLSQILELASLDVNKLREGQIEKLTVESFTDSIKDFKRRTQTALALRYVLQQRGVAIQPFKLPISQEDISQKVDQLKKKENQCVKQIRSEINIIIKDTELLLKQAALSDEMKQELSDVKQAMQVNIEHLDSGGSVTEIPNVFEIVTLESSVLPVEEEPAEEDIPAEAPVEEDVKSEETEIPAKKSFWSTFTAWLNSPWSTSWSSVKKKHSKK